MMLKKMVTEDGSIYYVMFENGFDDDELIVYTENKVQEMANAGFKRSLERKKKMDGESN